MSLQKNPVIYKTLLIKYQQWNLPFIAFKEACNASWQKAHGGGIYKTFLPLALI